MTTRLLKAKDRSPVCVLAGFALGASVGPGATAFVANVPYAKRLEVSETGASAFVIEHDGQVYSAMIERTRIAGDGENGSATIKGAIWK